MRKIGISMGVIYLIFGGLTGAMIALVALFDRGHPEREEPQDTYRDLAMAIRAGCFWPQTWARLMRSPQS